MCVAIETLYAYGFPIQICGEKTVAKKTKDQSPFQSAHPRRRMFHFGHLADPKCQVFRGPLISPGLWNFPFSGLGSGVSPCM